MRRQIIGLLTILAACGDDSAAPDAGGPEPCTDPPPPFAAGDADGHAEPLGSGPAEARAGRLDASEIPAQADELLTWAAGDFVLANDQIAVVIEDVGESDLYDPWGGRPVGIAKVQGGALVEPGLFGEQFFMTGRSTILTTSVTVLNDGSDGEPAVVRAAGRLAPLPFLDNLISALYFDPLDDIDAVIDYSLAPGAEQIDVTMRYASPRATDTPSGSLIHGFMYTDRFPTFVPDKGFTVQLNNALWVDLVDDDATGWAYHAADGDFDGSIAESGFVGAFTDEFDIARCAVTDHPHASIVIGGPGLDGLEAARRRTENIATRTITGTVTDGTDPMPGFHVHAVGADDSYLSRATTDASGNFSINVPEDANVTLTAYRRGWASATDTAAPGDVDAAITVPPSGTITVRVRDGGTPLPARIQVLPRNATTIPVTPDDFGEDRATSGRLHVEFTLGDDATLPVPPGDWTVVVSRGYEYDLFTQDVTVTAGNTESINASLSHVVDTTGMLCGDFHIHTHRSNDSGDDARLKLRSAVADGVEMPVRTDHEWVNSFQSIIEDLGAEDWAVGIGSIEMTSFQIWGHMGVFPLVEDPTKPNGGAPQWQTWPTADDPDTQVTTLSPKTVFDAVRARTEHPTVIINHPRGGADYFTYVGLDAATGEAMTRPQDWDEDFKLIEVFNDQNWLAERTRVVTDWFTLLNTGRKVFAVGSSDSHGIRSSPVGYPRTCVALGTDVPAAVTGDALRDQMEAGHGSISGGVYVSALVGASGPGDTVTGTGATATVDVVVQAADWIDVDAIDVVVDGETVQTIPLTATGAVVRYDAPITVDVASGGSWVVIAAYGGDQLEPVHPGRIPFGVTQPIFLEP